MHRSHVHRPRIDEHEIGRLAGLERPDLVPDTEGAGAVARRHGEGRPRVEDRRVEPQPLLEERRRPELVDQAHAVVRRSAVGPEPHEDSGVQHVRDARQAKHPQVGGEVVGDRGAALGEERDLLVLQPDRVGAEEPRAERTEFARCRTVVVPRVAFVCSFSAGISAMCICSGVPSFRARSTLASMSSSEQLKIVRRV